MTERIVTDINGRKYITNEPLLHGAKTQRTWVGMTDDEHMVLYTKADSGLHDWARAIEAKLKEKNT